MCEIQILYSYLLQISNIIFFVYYIFCWNILSLYCVLLVLLYIFKCTWTIFYNVGTLYKIILLNNYVSMNAQLVVYVYNLQVFN